MAKKATKRREWTSEQERTLKTLARKKTHPVDRTPFRPDR